MASGSSDAATSAIASGSSDAGNVCPGPPSILLLEEGYLVASRNATTATTRSRANHTVEVTLWVADPPAVSFFTFHCIRVPISKYIDVVDRRVHAVAAGAHGRFLLIRTLLSRFGSYEYFVYKSHPESPSLESIPPIPFRDSLNGTEFGIVPRGDGHYLLVALRSFMVKGKDYELYIYSSEAGEWMAKELSNPCPGFGKVLANKVFTLGDGSVLFVDLLKGMLKCDLDLRLEPLRAQYIPLPEPLPGNREKVNKYLLGVEFFRDLTCVDGRLIKFIDMEHRVIVSEIVTDVPAEEPVDPRTKDVYYDSDLIMRMSKRKQVEIKPMIKQSPDGWSATLWTREIGSNCWLKGSIVDVNDILVDDFPALLSSNKSESTGSLKFQDLKWVRPTLSMDGNDILYLKSTCRQSGVYKSVVAAVDLVEKTLKVEAPAVHKVGKEPPLKQILRPCALAKQLEITTGIKISANLIAQMRRSANEPKPNSTAICVGEPDSYESESKRPRHLAEEDDHAQTGAGTQNTVQNVLISQPHPNQNNMTPSLCFNRYQQPGYSGYSSWPHQNNPPPPSYFNNWARPYNPVYAPSTLAPNIQSYANYQSLPQQPLLQEQQTTPSMAFGPYMARPNQHFNNWYGASSYGIGSGVNEYAFGADSGSGLYHQR